MVIMSIIADSEHGNSKYSGPSDTPCSPGLWSRCVGEACCLHLTHRAPLGCGPDVSEKRAASILQADSLGYTHSTAYITANYRRDVQCCRKTPLQLTCTCALLIHNNIRKNFRSAWGFRRVLNAFAKNNY